MIKAKPLVKWAGGKRQLINELLAKTPSDFSVYHEFFLGGGALFFELYNQSRIKKAVLSDSNAQLMNLYSTVKSKPIELIEELKNTKYTNNEKTFYKIRGSEPVDKIERAARFVYLNKTAFNGLYRENLSGKFNVPFGKYANPTILDEENILAVSEALSSVKLLCGDFSEVLKYAKSNDFVYFDPPYAPISVTASFTAYTSRQFTFDDQIRLKKIFDELENRKVKVLLSNSNADAIHNLFNEKQISTVLANRIINCKAEKRGLIKEVLVTGAYL